MYTYSLREVNVIYMHTRMSIPACMAGAALNTHVYIIIER